jgi:hypothetical protein
MSADAGAQFNIHDAKTNLSRIIERWSTHQVEGLEDETDRLRSARPGERQVHPPGSDAPHSRQEVGVGRGLRDAPWQRGTPWHGSRLLRRGSPGRKPTVIAIHVTTVEELAGEDPHPTRSGE